MSAETFVPANGGGGNFENKYYNYHKQGQYISNCFG